jgi:hypothetical protein
MAGTESEREERKERKGKEKKGKRRARGTQLLSGERKNTHGTCEGNLSRILNIYGRIPSIK